MNAPQRYDLLIFDWDGTLMDSAGVIVDSIQRACADIGVPVPSERASRQIIGLGLVQAPGYAVHDLLAQGRPQAVLEDWQPPEQPIHMLYAPNRYLSAKVRAFIDWTVALFERHPGLRRE